MAFFASIASGVINLFTPSRKRRREDSDDTEEQKRPSSRIKLHQDSSSSPVHRIPGAFPDEEEEPPVQHRPARVLATPRGSRSRHRQNGRKENTAEEPHTPVDDPPIRIHTPTTHFPTMHHMPATRDVNAGEPAQQSSVAGPRKRARSATRAVTARGGESTSSPISAQEVDEYVEEAANTPKTSESLNTPSSPSSSSTYSASSSFTSESSLNVSRSLSDTEIEEPVEAHGPRIIPAEIIRERSPTPPTETYTRREESLFPITSAVRADTMLNGYFSERREEVLRLRRIARSESSTSPTNVFKVAQAKEKLHRIGSADDGVHKTHDRPKVHISCNLMTGEFSSASQETNSHDSIQDCTVFNEPGSSQDTTRLHSKTLSATERPITKEMQGILDKFLHEFKSPAVDVKQAFTRNAACPSGIHSTSVSASSSEASLPLPTLVAPSTDIPSQDLVPCEAQETATSSTTHNEVTGALVQIHQQQLNDSGQLNALISHVGALTGEVYQQHLKQQSMKEQINQMAQNQLNAAISSQALPQPQPTQDGAHTVNSEPQHVQAHNILAISNTQSVQGFTPYSTLSGESSNLSQPLVAQYNESFASDSAPINGSSNNFESSPAQSVENMDIDSGPCDRLNDVSQLSLPQTHNLSGSLQGVLEQESAPQNSFVQMPALASQMIEEQQEMELDDFIVDGGSQDCTRSEKVLYQTVDEPNGYEADDEEIIPNRTYQYQQSKQNLESARSAGHAIPMIPTYATPTVSTFEDKGFVPFSYPIHGIDTTTNTPVNSIEPGNRPACKFFRKGRCLRGDECRFSHAFPTMHDVQPNTRNNIASSKANRHATFYRPKSIAVNKYSSDWNEILSRPHPDTFLQPEKRLTGYGLDVYWAWAMTLISLLLRNRPMPEDLDPVGDAIIERVDTLERAIKEATFSEFSSSVVDPEIVMKNLKKLEEWYEKSKYPSKWPHRLLRAKDMLEGVVMVIMNKPLVSHNEDFAAANAAVAELNARWDDLNELLSMVKAETNPYIHRDEFRKMGLVIDDQSQACLSGLAMVSSAVVKRTKFPLGKMNSLKKDLLAWWNSLGRRDPIPAELHNAAQSLEALTLLFDIKRLAGSGQ